NEDQPQRLRPERHDREQDRIELSGCRVRARTILPDLPGGDSACDRVAAELRRADHRAPVRPIAGSALMSAAAHEYALRPSGGLRRRRIVNRIMESIGWAAALLAVGVLVLVTVSVAVRAWPALSIDFFTKPPNLFGGPGGGISSAIVGSALIVAMATAITLPIGVLIGIYLTEFAPRRLAAPIQLI